jgi:hypothetical protein
MSVMESFFFMFESDASKLNKGIDDAKHKAEGLAKGIVGIDKSASTLGSTMTSLISSVGGALLAGLSVSAIISQTIAVSKYNDKLNDMSDRLGVNIEDLSAWGDAVQMNGGTAESFQATVDSMTGSLQMFATKGVSRQAPFFKEMGIAMLDAHGKARQVMDILPEISSKFEGLSKTESAGLGQKMGLDQGTILLLQKGRREVDATIAKQRELGVVTKAEAEIAAKFNDQLDMTSHAFRSLFTTVGGSVLPALTWLSEGMQNVAVFWRKHSQLMVGGLIALGAAVAFFVVPPLIAMATAAVIAFAPFLLIGAAVAAVAAIFALLYEDIMMFKDGQNSLIGDIMAKYPIVADIFNFIGDVFNNLVGAFQWGFGIIGDLFDIGIALWGLLGDAITVGIDKFMKIEAVQAIIKAVTGAFQVMKGIVGGVFDALGIKLENFAKLFKWLKGLVSGFKVAVEAKIQSAKDALGIKGGYDPSKDITAGKEKLAVASHSTIGSQTSNSIANSSKNSSKQTTVHTGAITVQTQATDGEGVAGAIGKGLDNHIKQAADNFDDGIDN